MLSNIAYLSDGKLFLKRDGQPAELIESHFAQQLIERGERSRQRNDWKTKGAGSAFTGMGMGIGGRALWGMGDTRPDLRRVRITGITSGAQTGELVYALDTDNVGGLFLYNTAEKHEKRLFHRNDFRCRDLSRHGQADRMALSMLHDDGSANIAVMELGGRGIREVTEGDSLDEAPTWAPGPGQQIVFQSAGIGRNPRGAMVALSSYAIQKIDLENDKFETLLEDEGTDYLLPRVATDGSLYFIRRPYKPEGHADASGLKVALDILLFPYRLVRAIVHFLNFFSVMFSKKPLMTAGGPEKEGPDRRQLLLWGKWIDTEKALRESGKDKSISLVPSTWELVRRATNGTEEVLAKGALSFDLCPDGGVVYTNGTGIYHKPSGGEATRVCTDKIVEHVTVIPA
jgi:hypothetical protein